MRIKQKHVYGGLMVDKFFLVLEDDTQVQVPFAEWESLEEGDDFARLTPAVSPATEERIEVN